MYFGSLLLFIVLGVFIGNVKGIDFYNNSYYDVVVSISPDIEAEHNKSILIVDNIKVHTVVLNFYQT